MERIRGIILKTLTILAGFWLADLTAARIQTGIAAGESIEQIMDGMTTMLQHPLAMAGKWPRTPTPTSARTSR